MESSQYFWGMIAYVREENFLCTRRKFGFNKKYRTKSTFPPQKKNDTTSQLYCTLNKYVTPKNISRHNQKN